MHPEPNLFGRDAKERALVSMWTDIQTLEGYLAVQDVLRNAHPAFKGRALAGPVAYEQIPALAERGRQRAAAFFDRLEARLGVSEFVACERFTYADIVGFVCVEFSVRALRYDPAEKRERLQRWKERVAARPAIAAAKG
jgi:glutathione S-transferase